ncbi:MAG: J domain-containing protein [Pirellulales bacterium]
MSELFQRGAWPDGVDFLALSGFVALVLGLPALGYASMYVDFRAYLRSLSRVLVKAAAFFPGMPGWVRAETPRCIAALGLSLPCTEEDILQAYRQRVKRLHPDLGGNKQQFLRLQSHFEQSIRYLRQRPGAFCAMQD